MKPDERYDVVATGETRRGVACYEGAEEVTRLPVRIYRFRGPPRGSLERLEGAALPGVLGVEVDDDGDETRMIVVLPREYRPLADPGEPAGAGAATVGLRGVALLTAALRAVHEAGIVHGDLGPHRIWIAGADDVLLEGAGVPWDPDDDPEAPPVPQNPHEDVRALARTLLEHGDLPLRLRDLLTSVVDGRPDAPASAGALARAFEPHLPVLARPGEGSPTRGEGGGRPRGADAADRSEADRPTSGAPQGVLRPRQGGGARPRAVPEDASTEAPVSTRVMKSLPPGAVYHSGRLDPEDEDDPEDPPALDDRPAAARPRPPWTLLALLGAACAVAALSLLGQDRPVPVPTAGDGVSHVVQVTVDPPTSPPVEIAVVDSPSGSLFEPGARLGHAPRRIVVDREGRWVIRGSFGARTTDDAVFHVPGDDAVVLTLRASTPTP